ncbi:hypothetical protein PSTT_16558 [Puccinia striiformis]|uniref:Cyanovirin-N domain-containing protein n=1 Tax=Puccinia striiformis TaxID=27350 RepID=A0A2S4UCA3_9BASI|nr:hypothetical protein PSTT_16558 [Puccinia striiformis]
MFYSTVLRLLSVALVLVLHNKIDAKPTSAQKVLVCSGSTPVGNVLSNSGAYYAISDSAHNASGKCSCDDSTGRLECQVQPKFPISVPQGYAVCQAVGQTTCAVSHIYLCQGGKLIGGLNSEGAFYEPGRADKASGYCQCDPDNKKTNERLLRCPDYPHPRLLLSLNSLKNISNVLRKLTALLDSENFLPWTTSSSILYILVSQLPSRFYLSPKTDN